MTIEIIYKPLFEVKILHHYFLDKGGDTNDYVFFDNATAVIKETILSEYNIHTFLNIRPNQSTQKLLRKYNCVFRVQNDGFVVFIKVKYDAVLDSFVPFTALENDFSLAFEYNIIDHNFSNYTNLPLRLSEPNSIYFFENKTNGNARVAPNLCSLAPIRDNNSIYNEGEILSNNNNSRTLIANSITEVNNNPEQTFTTDFLVNNERVHYVNTNDTVKIALKNIYIDTGYTGSDDWVVTVVNENGESLTPKVTIIENDVATVQIILTGYKEGLYHISIEDLDDGIILQDKYYVLQQLKNIDGVINIHSISDNNAYNLLTNDGAITDDANGKQFTLRFKNRATTWRYKGKTFANNTPMSGPHLITQNGFVNITIEDDNNTSINDPPNPTPAMLVVEKPNVSPEHYNLYSDIFFNT